MTIEILDITRSINKLCDGLFFGFAIVTLLSILLYVLSKHQQVYKFLYLSVKIARVLALVYIIFYTLSLVYYFSTNASEYFNNRATGPYAAAYWFMIFRPFIFCGILQLLWVKTINQKLILIALISFLVLILSLFSASFFEIFVIATAAYSRDSWLDNATYDLELYLGIYILKNTILYAALVCIAYFINIKKLQD